MTTMLAVALALWGTISVFLAPPITIEYEPAPTYPEAYAFALRYGVDSQHIERCQIFVNPDGDFDALTLDQQQAVITHEVGHCLGLNHTARGLMFRAPLYYGGTITEADIAECHRVHPTRPVLPYHAVVSVAHD